MFNFFIIIIFWVISCFIFVFYYYFIFNIFIVRFKHYKKRYIKNKWKRNSFFNKNKRKKRMIYMIKNYCILKGDVFYLFWFNQNLKWLFSVLMLYIGWLLNFNIFLFSFFFIYFYLNIYQYMDIKELNYWSLLIIFI